MLLYAIEWLTGVAPTDRRAPEFVAKGEVRTACDVYAFGVVLCELLSNKPAVMPKDGEKARPPPLYLLLPPRAHASTPHVDRASLS